MPTVCSACGRTSGKCESCIRPDRSSQIASATTMEGWTASTNPNDLTRIIHVTGRYGGHLHQESVIVEGDILLKSDDERRARITDAKQKAMQSIVGWFSDNLPADAVPEPKSEPATMEQAIQAAGANVAPRVTPDDIEAEIASEHYYTAREGVLGMLAADGVPATAYEKANAAPAALDLLIHCVLVLRNGFTVTGESACASPENFDAEVGRKVARQAAVAKMWQLLGFRLRDKLAGQSA